MTEETPLTAAISKESIGFSVFAKAYVALVDDLVERRMSIDSACNTGIQLVNAYFQYNNNNKFAEAGGVIAFESAEED